MKRFIYLVVSLLICVAVHALGRGDVKALPKDSVTICRLLAEVQKQPTTTCVPLFFARQFIGVPYVAGTLEGDRQERLVINTRQLDCTTLVETVTALTLCAQHHQYSWNAYLEALASLRYRGGVIDGYTSRLHYFSEWISDNTKGGVVREIQSPNPPFSAVQLVSLGYMSSHPQNYQALREHPEFVSVINRMERLVSGARYRYIPKKSVANQRLLRQVIRDGDIIAITCKKTGLDIAHLGFAVWRKDGLHLLNASQLHRKVVIEPMTLYRYLRKHSSHTGIRIVRINK